MPILSSASAPGTSSPPVVDQTNGASSPVSAHSSGCPPVFVRMTRVWSRAEPRSTVVADKVNCPGSRGGGGGGVGGGGVVATAVVSDSRRVSDTVVGGVVVG